MKRTFLAVLAAFMVLTLTGCGSSHNDSPPVFVTSILSDSSFDGDIQQNFITGAFTVTRNTQSLFAGIDPISEDEYRAFLDFHLTGTNGVPGDAIINSAHLDIFINSIDTQFTTDTIPLRIDLVSFQPPDLFPSDFDRTALATVSVRPPISWADFGRHVKIDVTPLMIEAQRLGLLDFQVRIMEDFGIVTPGLIEINDTTTINRSILAPLLKVTYF